MTTAEPVAPIVPKSDHHMRFHAPNLHLSSAFGGDWFGTKAESFALHREALAAASLERQEVAARQAQQMLTLLEQNTELTRITRELTQRIEELTREIHVQTCVHEPR